MIDRRDFLKLTAVGGGAVFLSALQGVATAATKDAAKDYDEFFFVQMSDTHWGYSRSRKSRGGQYFEDGGNDGQCARAQTGLHRVHR